MWALADARTQAAIHRAHRDAVDLALGWAQAQIVFTRTGHNGAFQEPVRGVVAAAFDHWDSRAGDPHLHTHVVLANRVQTLDGRWRTLDSQTLHRYTVAVSELHEGVLADLLTERLGYTWTAHPRRHSPVPRWDITGVPLELMEEFSQRSTQIAANTDQLIAGFAATHGRHPTDVELQRLRQQATLATRPDKTQHSLGELCEQWRERAVNAVGSDPSEWVQTLTAGPDLANLAASSELALDDLSCAELATAVLETVAAKRATFGHANVLAEAHRRLHGTRFADPAERLRVAERITSAALQDAVMLNPPDPLSSDLRVHKGADLYSTRTIFDAETRLLDAGRDLTAPAAPPLEMTPATDDGGVELGADQAAAVTAVAKSGRRLDLLIGPAGTGKTTSLRALRAVWETHHGPGTVVGLAPSAAAAQVLAEQLGIPAENTTKWLLEHDRTPDRDRRIGHLQRQIDACSSLGSVRARRLTASLTDATRERDRWTLHPGQLLILDEASLAGTLHLDRITTAAVAANAKVLLVGDPMQLGPVDAGGAFTMLTHGRDSDRSAVAELTSPRRFEHAWERDATLRLRRGDPGVIGAYLQHGRVYAGDHDQNLEHVLQLWAADTDAGLDTLMIAADHATVTELNHRARAHLITVGAVTADGVRTSDAAAGTGDRIITRHNDRTLRYGRAGRDWVRNGDTWTITATHPDGSLTARNSAGSDIHLDAGYVTEHVELGYATTANLAQGRTLDTAHVVITPGMTREALYVAATRGRKTNTLNVTLDDDNDLAASHEAQPDTTEQILTRTLANSGTDTSAHTALRNHHDDSPEPQFPTPAAAPTAVAPAASQAVGPSF